ncbi:MAG TPA: hypothetical protein VNZ52_04520 [Candidatus Thermoplasmatota archaeon]|nr:hypothetical protein [Candidatus Thermoplasmatota archaeon]
MRAILVAALLLAVGFAGCMNDAPADTPAATANNSTITVDANRPPPIADGEVEVGPAAEPDLEATLMEAPKLKVGEWWRIRMYSPLDGSDVEVIRVMAKEVDGHYVFGMPHERWYKEAVVYHTPGFGDVTKELGYNAHNIPFHPVKFPLTDGATWQTNFETETPLTATAKQVDPYTVDITYTTPNGGVLMTATYDARIHEISKLKVDTMEYEVLEHGYDFKGWVTVPRAEKLVFIHGRLGPVFGLGSFPPQPAPPMDEVTIDEDFNRVTFVQIVGYSVSNEAHGKGVYRETVTDPDGNQYVTEMAGETAGYKIQFFENSNPKGTWKLEHVAGGPGIAFTEGIAYHQYDILVPEGHVRTDHSHPVVR